MYLYYLCIYLLYLFKICINTIVLMHILNKNKMHLKNYNIFLRSNFHNSFFLFLLRFKNSQEISKMVNTFSIFPNKYIYVR
jgi:hypothetical protein